MLTGSQLSAAAVFCSGLALLAVGCASRVGRSSLPIQDDFADDCKGWSHDEDENVFLGCKDGEYRVLFKSTEQQGKHFIPLRSEEDVGSASVEADATLRAFPGASDNGVEFHGVGCWVSPPNEPAQGYVFFVNPGNQAFAIVKMDETNESLAKQGYFTFLVEEDSEAVAGLGETNHIRGECRTTEDDRIALTMYLDGQQVGAASEVHGFSGFEAFGFMVFSTKAGTDLRYDNFRAARLGKADSE